MSLSTLPRRSSKVLNDVFHKVIFQLKDGGFKHYYSSLTFAKINDSNEAKEIVAVSPIPASFSIAIRTKKTCSKRNNLANKDRWDLETLIKEMVTDTIEDFEDKQFEIYKILNQRGRRERLDSVTSNIMKERISHLLRLYDYDPDEKFVNEFLQKGLGQKKKAKDAAKFRYGVKDESSTLGAMGFAQLLGSATSRWPIFKHMLPEVAFAGHSNSGKSTLVNAISGLHTNRGVASVSDRAGWTEAIYFYQLGKKPPVMTLADLPGYGHAVATTRMMGTWKKMVERYLFERNILVRCCILVDCTRGLCKDDYKLLKILKQKKVSYQIILTKGDLLNVKKLAQSKTLIIDDLEQNGHFNCPVDIVSANTGAGIDVLWQNLMNVSLSHSAEFMIDENGNQMKLNSSQNLSTKSTTQVPVHIGSLMTNDNGTISSTNYIN